MHIGFDVAPITRTRTGVGNYCFYLLKHLLSLAGNGSFTGFSAGRSRVDLGELGDRLPFRRIPIPARVLYALWDRSLFPPMDRLLRGLDVYHATNYFLPPAGRAKRALTIHDLAHLAVPEVCDHRIVKPFAAGLRRFASAADALLVYSESTKRDIVDYFDIDPKRITVTPMAVDDAFVVMPRDEAVERLAVRHGITGPILLFVSTLEPRKNVMGLVRAFALLQHEIPHRLVLVGGVGRNSDEVFSEIEILGISGRVVHVGFVSHLELPAFYCAADAFVFPTHYEGFGIPLLEALVCGCPVVTSDNSSVPEVTGGAALCVDSNDIESFADAVRTVLNDSDLRDSMVAKGKAHAQTYSWRRCAEQTYAVYESLAS